MTKSAFVYTTYIKTSPEKLWHAITNTEFMKQYWFGALVESDWKAGSPWKMSFPDGEVCDAGEIVESIPTKRLVIKWRNEWKAELKAEGYSQCAFEIEPADGAMKLTVTHSIDKVPSKFIEAVSGGWPKIISNLKSILETGKIAVDGRMDCRTKPA